MTLVMIVAAALAGGVLSTLAAAATLRIDATWIPRFVSFAVGALLGAVFLELLPHALAEGDAHSVMQTVLIGLLGFYRVTQSAQFDSYRTVDVIQLVGSGACFGAALVGSMVMLLRPRN